jgi:aspartate-semialdehyde dehydrogenase
MANIGIVGCTGAVGMTVLELLEGKNHKVTCMASSRSVGNKISIGKSEHRIEEFSVDGCKNHDVVFLCVSGDFSRNYGPHLAQHSYVIDNSSAFRYQSDIPLLVPAINGSVYRGERLIANPNCMSAIALMVLGPLQSEYGLDSVIMSSYQAASGAGREGMIELAKRTGDFVDYGHDNAGQHFQHNLAYNVIPQIDVFESNLYTREEMKIVWELRKVLGLPHLPVSATAVRVPVMRSHAASLTLRLGKPAPSLESVRDLLGQSTGVDVVDMPAKSQYPMPMTSTGKHNIEVGRIRHNLIYGHHGIDLFVSGDQLLRGAALNAYEIMQFIFESPYMSV